ncbi:hypothetical protein ARMGADRAFT_1132765 [Armillaria gallica]|uniref:Uncharacterized protein n=1 Tax=Armillaria gallica TaxID=47427 RepID=A0A2H3D691_ARMGA|nr:hypothetical protein ARMGADRAFT_1132765 [Armillaria gallica]
MRLEILKGGDIIADNYNKEVNDYFQDDITTRTSTLIIGGTVANVECRLLNVMSDPKVGKYTGHTVKNWGKARKAHEIKTTEGRRDRIFAVDHEIVSFGNVDILLYARKTGLKKIGCPTLYYHHANVSFKGVPECRPGTPGREGGSNAGHEKIYMTSQNFNVFLSKLV